MKVDEVKQQLEEMKEERFLLVGRLDDLCAMQMEMKLKLEVMHPGASKEQMDAALAHLARLDASNASNASNVADVSAAVEAQLGAHAGKYKQLVQDGLDKSCAKMKRLEKVLLENAGNNASIITEKLDRQGGSLAEMHQMLFSWRMEQKQAREKEREDTEKVKSGVQSSAGRFWERFEYAPFPTEEGDIQIGVDEQSELGEGSFATTYRMSAVNGATPGVEKGQLFAVKKVVLLSRCYRAGVGLFKRALSDYVLVQKVFRAHRKTVPRAEKVHNDLEIRSVLQDSARIRLKSPIANLTAY